MKKEMVKLFINYFNSDSFLLMLWDSCLVKCNIGFFRNCCVVFSGGGYWDESVRFGDKGYFGVVLELVIIYFLMDLECIVCLDS